MKTRLPSIKPKYVIGQQYLPMSLYKVVTWLLIYVLFSKVYEFPNWADYTFYGLWFVVVIGIATLMGKQVEVNPFEGE